MKMDANTCDIIYPFVHTSRITSVNWSIEYNYEILLLGRTGVRITGLLLSLAKPEKPLYLSPRPWPRLPESAPKSAFRLISALSGTHVSTLGMVSNAIFCQKTIQDKKIRNAFERYT